MAFQKNRVISPEGIRPPFAQYSHGLLVQPGARLLFTSGQLGVSPTDHVPDSVEEQAVLCFENIGAILRAANMDFGDVVRFSAFVTERASFEIYGAVRVAARLAFMNSMMPGKMEANTIR